MDYGLLAAIGGGVALLLVLILMVRLHAFLALLISSIAVGLLAGLDAAAIIDTVQTGMGGVLGFVATVVGLGALFGAVLEHSGGAQAVTAGLLRAFGERRAPSAMALAGFVIAIPVFFDVAFIILMPMLYALQRRTGKSLLLYAIPLLAGLAATHAFIPPTPGPIAVADILGASLGYVIGIGFAVGLPAVAVSGLWFGRYIGARVLVAAPPLEAPAKRVDLPSLGLILAIIALPIVLILLNTSVSGGLLPVRDPTALNLITLLGHPFTALILANLAAWYLLGIRRGFTRRQLLDIGSKSLAPAGTIILLTGAGGVFKQVLVNTGGGKMLAEGLTEAGIPVLLFAFFAAALVRILQGSATVAMITAAGLTAPLLASGAYSPVRLACLVIAIAAGASILSHVNDSGFWLVKEYLGLDERQTFRSWTVMTTLLALSGLLFVSVVWLLVN